MQSMMNKDDPPSPVFWFGLNIVNHTRCRQSELDGGGAPNGSTNTHVILHWAAFVRVLAKAWSLGGSHDGYTALRDAGDYYFSDEFDVLGNKPSKQRQVAGTGGLCQDGGADPWGQGRYKVAREVAAALEAHRAREAAKAAAERAAAVEALVDGR